MSSSAASSEDTMTVREQISSRSAAAVAPHACVAPPTMRGTVSCGLRELPGSIRSGENATLTLPPAIRPRRTSGSTSSSRVAPT